MRSFATNATRHEREITKVLGVTDAGLEVLLKHARTGRVGGNAWPRLMRQGLVNGDGLTDAGREIVRKARAMGY